MPNAVLRNGSEVTVRPLSVDDGTLLGDFYESIPEKDFHFYCPHGLTRENAEKKANMALAPNFICLVIETELNEIAGYAWYTWETDASRESVFGICIKPDHQGIGSGRLLMERLFEKAKTTGPSIMSLTVQLANKRAVALYSDMGFKIIREQLREADNEPEYYMEYTVRP
ncbi:MAG: GNAT family N-acetyltransferase [Armatimonadota bacterium]